MPGRAVQRAGGDGSRLRGSERTSVLPDGAFLSGKPNWWTRGCCGRHGQERHAGGRIWASKTIVRVMRWEMMLLMLQKLGRGDLAESLESCGVAGGFDD